MEKLRFIELTSTYDKKPIYININMIGDIRQDVGYSVIGHLTHNNGGFKVTQDVEEILDLLNNLDN
jgi:hypothetical protein